MSNLVDLYNTTDKQRPKESRDRIPLAETDFWDREHNDADGFTVQRRKGDPTQFTEDAQNEYHTDKNELVPPESFNPEFPLHRYTPENPFFNPGQADTSQE